MLRAVSILAILTCTLIGSSLGAQEELLLRKWTTATGTFKADGKLLGRTDTHVTLRTVKHDSLDVAIELLSEKDKQFLKGLDIVDANHAQLETIKPHLENLAESPLTVLEIMEEVNRVQPQSPYAALIGGVICATENGDFKKAKRLFDMSAEALESQREIMGPDFQLRTGKSIVNNMAVCSIYMGKSSQIIKHLKEGFEGEVSFDLYHNTKLYFETSSKAKASGLSKSSRKRLVSLIAVKPPKKPPVGIPQRYLLSISSDRPMTPQTWSEKFDALNGAEKRVKAKADKIDPDARQVRSFNSRILSLEYLRDHELFPVLWCMECGRDGIRGCPNRCSNGKFSHRTKVRTGTFPVSGDPIYSWSTKYTTCQTCRGKGRLKCRSCKNGKISLTGPATR